MTERECAILSAYTGILCGDFNWFHKYVEEILKRPVYTHEFAERKLWDEIKEKSKPDFLKLNFGDEVVTKVEYPTVDVPTKQKLEFSQALDSLVALAKRYEKSTKAKVIIPIDGMAYAIDEIKTLIVDCFETKGEKSKKSHDLSPIPVDIPEPDPIFGRLEPGRRKK